MADRRVAARERAHNADPLEVTVDLAQLCTTDPKLTIELGEIIHARLAGESSIPARAARVSCNMGLLVANNWLGNWEDVLQISNALLSGGMAERLIFMATPKLRSAVEILNARSKKLTGDELGFSQSITAILKKLKAGASEEHFLLVTGLCIQWPNAVNDWPALVELVESNCRRKWDSADHTATLGAVLYRAGRPDQATEPLERSIELFAGLDRDALKNIAQSRAALPLYMAMSCISLGQIIEARNWLQAGTKLAQRELDGPPDELGAARELLLKGLVAEAARVVHEIRTKTGDHR